MPNPGTIDQNRDLLANLKQDERNSVHFEEPQASKEHISGAMGKLSSAIAQHQGETDLSEGSRGIARQIDASGGEVDRDAIQESLHARADAKIKEQYGEDPERMEAGSEASRLQSAAEQYDLARAGKQTMPQDKLG